MPNTPISEPRAERALSLSYYTVPELTPVETVEIAAACGFAHVGLRLLGAQPGGGETPLLVDAAVRRRVAAAMRDTGVTALDANTARLVASTDVNAYLPMLDAAASLGARHVLATGDDPDLGRLANNLFALGEAATARGLTVDLEFVPWQAVPDLDAAAALVRACGHPALGIAVDALHFHRSASAVGALAALPPSWFRYVQLCDAPSLDAPPARDDLVHEATRERLVPGDGVIDLLGLLAALPPSLPIALEVPQATLSASVGSRQRVARIARATRALLGIEDSA